MANEYDNLMRSLGLLDPEVGQEIAQTIRTTDTQWRERATETESDRELREKTGGAISPRDIADLATIMMRRGE